MGEQAKLIEAAARAGVKWILPTEYAGDGLNVDMVEAVPLFHPKRKARMQIEELSGEFEGLRWIGIATNPWLEAVCSFFSPSCSTDHTVSIFPCGPFYVMSIFCDDLSFLWQGDTVKDSQKDNLAPSLTQEKTEHPTLPLRPKPHPKNSNPLPGRRPLQHHHPPASEQRNNPPALPPDPKPLRTSSFPLPLRKQLRLPLLFPRNAREHSRFDPASD